MRSGKRTTQTSEDSAIHQGQYPLKFHWLDQNIKHFSSENGNKKTEDSITRTPNLAIKAEKPSKGARQEESCSWWIWVSPLDSPVGDAEALKST